MGTRSLPIHWINKNNTGDPLSVSVDLDITHTDAGVYIQIQPKQAVNAEVSLKLKGEYQYETIPLNQIQTSVYLTAPIPPVWFENVDQIEAILKGPLNDRFVLIFLIQWPCQAHLSR